MIKIEYDTLTAKEWAYLRKNINWTIYPHHVFSKAIDNSLLIVTAYDGNKIVGMARLLGDNIFSFFIQDVIVIPAYQNQGIGTLLVNSLIAYIKTTTDSYTIINLMSSAGKESFYEKFGFIKRNGNPKGYGMELIINPN